MKVCHDDRPLHWFHCEDATVTSPSTNALRPPLRNPPSGAVAVNDQIVELTAVKQYTSVPQLKIVIEPLPALAVQGR
jgi:hypothetical protein